MTQNHKAALLVERHAKKFSTQPPELNEFATPEKFNLHVELRAAQLEYLATFARQK